MENNNPQEAPAIYWRIDEWFPDLSPEVKSGLKTYHEELVKFNRTLSLISPKSMPVADALHFADSIQAVSIVTATHPEIDKIFDLGSGSGFPGVVFAIMNPKIQVVLVEIDKKKAEFLSHIVSVLGLENAKVENRNIEALEANSVEYAIVRG
ncbi:MAG TPA: RsmG family class I SAM-dependent methyltransferase, partial [Bdellovibrio sp.]|nr:RsmG family class I SAM-dependent methyltransferase [Bdellovibrio sp.]